MKQLPNTMGKIEEYKIELIALTDDPILKRLIAAYNFPEPVKSMETELDRILQEVLHEENKESNNSGL
jgi:hypothetical protein